MKRNVRALSLLVMCLSAGSHLHAMDGSDSEGFGSETKDPTGVWAKRQVMNKEMKELFEQRKAGKEANKPIRENLLAQLKAEFKAHQLGDN